METPQERTLRARLAAQTLHSRVDSKEHTEPARAAFLAGFEDEVDPDRTLPEAERKRRAESARKAHFTRLALKSAQARRKAKSTNAREAAAANGDLSNHEPRPARTPQGTPGVEARDAA